jgi:hypothetical protein
MTLAYMEKTAQIMTERGFSLVVKDEVLGEITEGNVRSVRFCLHRGDNESLVMETVIHPEHNLRFFIEILAWHGLTSRSYPLDSWKHWKDRVEFRMYEDHETGTGFAWVMALPNVKE